MFNQIFELVFMKSCLSFQVWFKNRRAKWRKQKREQQEAAKRSTDGAVATSTKAAEVTSDEEDDCGRSSPEMDDYPSPPSKSRSEAAETIVKVEDCLPSESNLEIDVTKDFEPNPHELRHQDSEQRILPS